MGKSQRDGRTLSYPKLTEAETSVHFCRQGCVSADRQLHCSTVSKATLSTRVLQCCSVPPMQCLEDVCSNTQLSIQSPCPGLESTHHFSFFSSGIFYRWAPFCRPTILPEFVKLPCLNTKAVNHFKRLLNENFAKQITIFKLLCNPLFEV